jgi:hypothetical protein
MIDVNRMLNFDLKRNLRYHPRSSSISNVTPFAATYVTPISTYTGLQIAHGE